MKEVLHPNGSPAIGTGIGVPTADDRKGPPGCGAGGPSTGVRHQRSFAPSWTMRPGRADVITPKFAAVMFCDTPENCGWLNALKASTRNCSVALLGREKFLKKPRSRLLMPGPRRMLRPELPKEPSAGWAKAAGVEPLLDRAAAGVDVAHDVRPVGAEACRGRLPRRPRRPRSGSRPARGRSRSSASRRSAPASGRRRRRRSARPCRRAGSRRSSRPRGGPRRTTRGRGRAPRRGCSGTPASRRTRSRRCPPRRTCCRCSSPRCRRPTPATPGHDA